MVKLVRVTGDEDTPPVPLRRLKKPHPHEGSFIDPLVSALRKTETDRDDALRQLKETREHLAQCRDLILRIREAAGLREGDGVSLLGHIRAIMIERDLDKTVIARSPLTDPKPR